jgi:hypothetical protein
LFVEFTSKTAEASGDVVLIPTCAKEKIEARRKPEIKILFFML